MSYVSRLGALVAASALVVTGLSVVAAPAQADPYLRPMNQGATWLAGQLTNGLIHNPNFGGFDDLGLSIDTAVALDEVGGYESQVAAIGTAIRNNYYDYTIPYGGPTTYAGAIAKALVMAQIASTGPASYPVALRTDLEDRTSGTAPIVGRIENDGETEYVEPYNPTDTANVFGQALAARALVVAGSTEAPTALSFLLAQQCADGGFREKFDAKDDTLQGCDPADLTATGGDRIGATATAVLNLAAISGEPGVSTVLDNARGWLKSQQNLDGSFGPNGGNANTTGLAARAIGDSPQAALAAGWLRALQINDTDKCNKAGAALGGVAFKAASLADYRSSGVPTTDVSNLKQDELRRATAQALPALRFLDGPDPVTLNLTGPAGFLQASKPVSYSVTGATPSSALCVSTASSTAATTANGTGAATAALTLPAGTANRTITVTDSEGNTDTAPATVLGIKTLTVKPAARRIKRGGNVKVSVSGLAPGESVKLRYRGVVVSTGVATASGTFVRTIRVRRVLGYAKIAATGQFPTIRKGSTTIRVIR